ncbi:HD-GYP domain-containing protein [Alkalicoccus urumqiensis]|uniref:HD-GYP domain-containing protein n=1 Tax=Alkalicoccus urumqiensis TaxID=1548213 RepID=A0A2P6MFJ5_ALKUR|nr:HD-GYP domain-containing protein [Alkalicoccus urumqiensis]PRO65065.1 hypothetical protein C6I21_11500 [Alkalicoccus urumqiensis]
MEVCDIRYGAVQVLDRSLAEDIVSAGGTVLLRSGTILHARHLELLLKHGINQVRVEGWSPMSDQLEWKFHEEAPLFSTHYQTVFSSLETLFEEVGRGETPDAEETVKSFDTLVQDALSHQRVYLVLQQIRGHDMYTYRHSIHVGLWCALIARINGYNEEDVLEFGRAGLLHDIGKLRIPKHIIQKKGSLTDEEFAEIKRHPEYGVELLEPKGYSSLILDGTLLHHERLDGSGYPFGRKAKDLPPAARITGVADVYDAVSSDRPYQQRRSPLSALQLIADELYSGRLCGVFGYPFVSHMLKAYVGADVLLSDGRTGHILRIPMEAIESPVILSGTTIINLKDEADLRILDIVEKQ